MFFICWLLVGFCFIYSGFWQGLGFYSGFTCFVWFIKPYYCRFFSDFFFLGFSGKSQIIGMFLFQKSGFVVVLRCFEVCCV